MSDFFSKIFKEKKADTKPSETVKLQKVKTNKPYSAHIVDYNGRFWVLLNFKKEVVNDFELQDTLSDIDGVELISADTKYKIALGVGLLFDANAILEEVENRISGKGLDSLKAKINDAIASEDYEMAGRLTKILTRVKTQ